MGYQATKFVAMLAIEGVQLLDVAGPLDVFAEANAQMGSVVYKLGILGTSAGSIRTSSGVRLMADASFDQFQGKIHTLLVAGTPKATTDRPAPAMLSWLKKTVPHTRRYGSVCSGALLLAATGLLDGKEVTTHWSVADHLQQKHPKVRVKKDELYIRDGRVRTAAGVTAGLDLALALVEEDLGRELAMKVASQLVMYFKRSGGQMQFSRQGEAAPAGRSALQDIQRYVMANPAADLNINSLASRLGLSPRHFSRMFHHELGCTPAAWVLASRVTSARQLFETGMAPPKQVALQCGFADLNTMRRAFMNHVGVTPAEYRRQFARVQD